MKWMKLDRYPVFQSSRFAFLFSENHMALSRILRLPISLLALVGMIVLSLIMDLIYRFNIIASVGFSRASSNQLVSPSLYLLGDDFVHRRPLAQVLIDTSLMWPFLFSAIWLIPQDILLSSCCVFMNLLCSPMLLAHHTMLVLSYTGYGHPCHITSSLYMTNRVDSQSAHHAVFYRHKKHSESKNALNEYQSLFLPFNPLHVLNKVIFTA